MTPLRKILDTLYIELSNTRRLIDVFKVDEERLARQTPKDKTCEFYSTGHYLEKGQIQGNIFQLEYKEKFLI